jgi:dTDP-glucose 4,6-dehydratase
MLKVSRRLQNILVTGGCGFIGVNFIHYILSQSDFTGRIINLDALTYAGKQESLADIGDNPRYIFERADIRDGESIQQIFSRYDIDTVVHFAAESHVDRSIVGPKAFVETNVLGTFNVLEAARNFWTNENGDFKEGVLFHHISTDEVYGSLGEKGAFIESTAYAPRSPYSASKASSDHFVMAYWYTYGLPVTLSNCSNNYGPYQFPEKLIPLMVTNMLVEKPLPVYGDGKNIRDWVYVEDHCSAIWSILRNGKNGEKYNIGGENEWENIRLVNTLIDIVARKTGKDANILRRLITFVKDRPGHDRRYAIDCSKIKRELGWRRSVSFAEGLEKTVEWYIDNSKWIEVVKNK